MRTKSMSKWGALLCAAMTLTAVAGAQTPAAPRKLTFAFVQGDDHVAIEVDGDDVHVQQNGLPVPAERVQRNGSTIQIHDDGGRPIAQLLLFGSGGSLTTMPRLPQRMRLGVSLDETPEAVAEQLGLDPDTTICITQVEDDKAAARAGLRKHDVVTAIDGEQPVTRAKLAEVMQTKKVGDRVSLRVLRHGKATDVDLALTEADQVASDQAASPWLRYVTGDGATNPFVFSVPSADWSKAASQWGRVADAFKEYRALDPNVALQYFSPYSPDPLAGEQSQHFDRQIEQLEKRLAALAELLEKFDQRLERRGDK